MPDALALRSLALPASLALLFAPACGGAGGAVEEVLTDEDGDGLADEYEDDIGTETDESDTDGDGWDDFEEVMGFSDPADEGDHPYLGGWPRSPYPADLAERETGNEEGDLADDFELTDQYGDRVSLWSFYGNVIVLDSGAFW